MMPIFADGFPTGWSAISLCASEVIRPRRNLPWSTITAYIVVIVAYVLTALSFHIGVPLEDILDTNGHDEFGVLWGRRAFGDVGASIVAAAICISLIGAVTGLAFGTSRLLRSSANRQDEYLPFSRGFRWSPKRLGTASM